MDILIRMNTRVLGGWLGSKISAGQSGGVSLLGQLGPFHFSLTLNMFIYSFMSLFSYAFRFPLANLFIYLFFYLFIYLFT